MPYVALSLLCFLSLTHGNFLHQPHAVHEYNKVLHRGDTNDLLKAKDFAATWLRASRRWRSTVQRPFGTIAARTGTTRTSFSAIEANGEKETTATDPWRLLSFASHQCRFLSPPRGDKEASLALKSGSGSDPAREVLGAVD